MKENFHLIEKVWEQFKVEYPDLVKLCYPRRINPPNGYPNPKYYAASLAAFLLLANREFPGRDKSMGACELATDSLVRVQVPTYFVAEDFLNAVAATEPPPDTALSAINWAMEAMVLVFPEAWIRKYLGGHLIPFVGVSRNMQGTRLIRWPQVKTVQIDMSVISEDDQAIFHFPLYVHGGMPIDYTSVYGLHKTITEVVSVPAITDWTLGTGKLDWLAMAPSGEAELVVQRKMNALVCRVLLAMTARPEYIEAGTCVRPRKVNQRTGVLEYDALWSPNYVGKAYRIKHAKSEGDGTGTSPRSHWRRGHMRNQGYGREHKQFYKIIWIEPMLISV